MTVLIVRKKADLPRHTRFLRIETNHLLAIEVEKGQLYARADKRPWQGDFKT